VFAQMTGDYKLLKLKAFDELLDTPLAEPRLSALLLGGFGAVALILAALGLYGVMSSAVREQRREIGIRIALGAPPRLIWRTVVDRALRVAGTGALVGLGCALVGTRVLRSQLFGVSPSDPATLVGVSVILLGVALVAAYGPARQATHIDAMSVLRGD
jgi:putative ABC transport system permease protein